MMKKIFSLVFALVLLTSMPMYAGASSTIKVNGEGKIKLKPDMCTIEFSSISRNKSQEKALAENTQKTNKLIDAFKKAGAKEGDIITQDFNMREEYKYDSNGEQVDKNYVITNTTELSLRDLDKIGSFIELASKNGADSIGYLRYNSTKADQAYGQALDLAIKNAREKTNFIGKSLGVNIKSISLIEETSGNFYGRVQPMNSGLRQEKALDLSIEVKDLEISASIVMESIY